MWSHAVGIEERLVQVSVNGIPEIDIDAKEDEPFPSGRLGFYNFSQSAVRYTSFDVIGIIGNEASPVTLNRSFTDASTLDAHTATIDWSDTTSSPAAVTTEDGVGSLSATHTYADDGSYIITVTLDDDDSGQTIDTLSAAIANVDPTVDANGPYSVDEGASVSLSATGSDVAGAADPLTYAWDLDNDGSFETPGQNVSFDGAEGPSTHTVNVQVSDGDGGTAVDSATVTVTNVAPTATFNVGGPVDEGTSFNLSLTAPSDPSGADTAAGFQYAFDCGSGLSAFGNANPASCSTDDSGTPNVSRVIRDKDGWQTPYNGQVTVNNVTPTATFNVGGPVDEGTSFNLSLTAPSDPSGADTVAGFQYAFDCGSGLSAFGNANSASCSTDDSGTPNVSGMIRDKDGGQTPYNGQVTVNNVAPTATFNVGGPVGARTSFSLSLTAPSDPSGADTVAGFQYAFDCGSGLSAFGNANSASCSTDDNGTPNVSGVIRDKDGEQTPYNGQTTVNNVAPTVNAGPPTAENFSGQVHEINATFTDPGVVDTHTGTIDWGEGAGDEPVSVTQGAGSGSLSGSHQYLVTRTYNIVVTVTDKDGDSGAGAQEKTVIRLTVIIDVQPRGDPNPINLGTKGVIPGGVFSGEFGGVGFDASTIVGSSLVFEGTGIAHGDSHVEDLDGTGPLDSVSHYRTQETSLTDSSVEGWLTGETSGGIAFTGCDSVRIVSPDNSNAGGGGNGKGKGNK